MNVASLPLCKELFELSEWGEDWRDKPEHSWYSFEGKRTGSYWEAVYDERRNRDPYDDRRPTSITHHINKVCPAYSLGYLLRKLPGHIALQSTTWDGVHTARNEGQSEDYQAVACYQSGIKGLLVQQVASTPEDALTKLAIELFKQGVLKREVV